MKHKLQRYYGRKELHFITFSCYQRRSLLASARARNVFVKILADVRARYPFLLMGYVVMPEHVHLLMSEPARETPSKILQVLKQRVSRAMRRKKRRGGKSQLRLPFPEEESGLKRFWQRRYYDFNRMEPGQTERETELYACESSSEETGEASEELAMEQLELL